MLTTYVVTSALDIGLGSLRAAILSADQNPGMNDQIQFDINGGGLQTILVLSSLPTITDPLVIDGTSQPGYSGTPLVQVYGYFTGGAGLDLEAGSDGSTVKGLIIDNFSGDGIVVNSTNDTIMSNWIGLNAFGNAFLTNNGSGINVEAGATGTTIGGDSHGNVISGNSMYGININGANTTVQGNIIGLDATGTFAVANGYGVFVNGAANTTIGGTTAAARNIISANIADGVDIVGASAINNLVEGNYIGTDITGSASGKGNGANGIDLSNDASANTVGGTIAGAGNLIAGNNYGIYINASNNSVQGNTIGLNAAGTGQIANSVGIYLYDAAHNTIGGTSAGAMNLISGNTNAGVQVTGNTSADDTITENSIYANGSYGIILGAAFTANNGLLSANEPNLYIDSPVFTTCTLLANTLRVSGYVGSAANESVFAGCRVEVFVSDDSSGYGSGKTFLGYLTADANGNFSGTLAVSNLSAGAYLTATATDANGDTSEFGSNAVVLNGTTTTTGPSMLVTNYGQSVTFTDTISGSGSPTGTVTFKDGSTTLGMRTLSGGTASFTTTTLSVGTHSITAVYSGDGSHSPNTSSAVSVVVDPYVLNYTIHNDTATYGTAANLAADLPTTISTGINGENLDITYGSTGDTTTAHVGTYSISGTVSNGTGLVSNYTVILTPGTLTVGTYDFSYQIQSDSATYGTAANLAADLRSTVSTGVNGQTLSLVYSSTGDSGTAHAGFYAITAMVNNGTGTASDYDVTFTNGTLTVGRYSVSYTILNDTATYGTAANLAADLPATINTGVNGQTLDISYGSTGDTSTAHVGQYQITGVVSSGSGLDSDYHVTLTSGTLAVGSYHFSYTIHNDTAIYGTEARFTADLPPTIVTGVNGQNLDIVYSSTGDTASAHTGHYQITGVVSSGTGMASDYTVTLTPGTLTVAPYTFTYTIGNLSVTYGTATNLAHDLPATIATGIQTMYLDVTYSSAGNSGTAHAGNYSITATLANGTGLTTDYMVTVIDGTLDITPASLTITADNLSMTYGSPVPTLTASYQGFVNDDTSRSLSAQPTLSTTATSVSSVGTYAIVASEATDPDYTIHYQSGSLTVTPAVLQVIADNASKTVGQENPALTAQYEGFVNGDSTLSLAGAVSFTVAANSSSMAGTYAITPAGLSSANYTIVYVGGSLTVYATSSATISEPVPVPQAVVSVKTAAKVNGVSTQPAATAATPTSSLYSAALTFPITADLAFLPENNLAAAAGNAAVLRILGGGGSPVGTNDGSDGAAPNPGRAQAREVPGRGVANVLPPQVAPPIVPPEIQQPKENVVRNIVADRAARVGTVTTRLAADLARQSDMINDQVHEAIDNAHRLSGPITATLSGSAVLTAGYILVTSRTTAWLLSLLMTRPLFKQFDPLEILFAWEREQAKQPSRDKGRRNQETLQELVK